MIEQIYRIGYVTREKERDYDPMGNATVCEAIERLERLSQLAKQVAKGNFNQADVIKEAKELTGKL
jgi:hypothetical protein